MIQIEWCWFHAKIFILGQVMTKKRRIFGHMSFGHNSANSGPIGLIFWATFCGKMGVAITRAPNGLGPPNPTKKSAHWVDLLGQPLS